MADAMARRSPLEGFDLRLARRGVTLSDPGPAARFILRGNADVARRAGTVLGLEVPLAPCRAARTDAIAALWLGPDEWLLLAPGTDGAAIAEGLRAALADRPHSLVDIGHRQAAIVLRGARAA